MKQKPKISVVVPVYNVAQYIRKCIESILCQTYKNLEIIIIDDGSTDVSADICENISHCDSRVRLIRQTHCGVAVMRNVGIDISTGDYIGFVDSDDWIAPDMIEMLYQNAEKYDADISECAIRNARMDETDNILSEEKTISPLVVLEGIDKIIDNMHRSNHSMCNKLFRAYLFEGIRLPQGRIYEDLATTYRLIDRANKIVISQKEKYFYVSRGGSITRQNFIISHTDVLWASEQRYQYIVGKYPELEKECRKYILSNLIWVIKKAYKDCYLENHTEELQEIVDSLRVYDYHDCGLSKEQVSALRFMFRGLKSYIAAVKMFAQ